MRNIWILILISMVLQGCSNDSSSSEDNVKVGKFIDSAVQGLSYISTPSGLLGETNAEGKFKYENDDVIEFFAGSLSLGVFQSQPVISPFDLDHLLKTENGREKSKNIITLLQSLDEDRDPNNGIDIRDAVLNDTHHELQSVDLSAPVYKFSKNQASLDLLNRLTGEASFVPLVDALIHAFENGFIELSTTQVYLNLVLDASATVLTQSGATLKSDGSAIGIIQAGTSNGYLTQFIDVTFADGTTSQLVMAAGGSAGEIASQFSELEGVEALASTIATIVAGNFTNASGLMNITLNGISFQPAGATVAQQLADLGVKINASSLVGVSANIASETGDLRITQDQGADLVFGFSGGGADSFEVEGTDSVPRALTLNTAQTQATVGGTINIVIDEGISFTNASATSPIIADFSAVSFINNQFLPADPGTYNHATSSALYDSLGNSHVLTAYFVRQQTTNAQVNTWQIHVLIDGRDVGDSLIGNTPSRATFNLVFNPDGTMNTALSDAILISNWTPLGADGLANGALMPLHVVDGGRLLVEYPPQSSNFEIELNGKQLSTDFKVFDNYQNGVAMSDVFKDGSVVTGQFIDSPVQGLRYLSASFSGSTNASGEFQYRIAESTEFFAGSLSLGRFHNNAYITPFSSNTNSADRDKAKNTLRLLQSLDDDSIPENGIDIRSAIANDQDETLADIDLNALVSTFGSDTEHQQILSQLTNTSAFVPLQDALNHTVNEMLSVGINSPLLRTTKVTLEASLDSSELSIVEEFSLENVSSYNHSVTVDIYDSLGGIHQLALYLVKSSENEVWKIYTLINGRDVGDALIGTTPSNAVLQIDLEETGATVKRSFLISNWDPVDAEGLPSGAFRPLNKVDGGSLPIDMIRANSNFEIVLDLSLFASDFEVSELYQDGFGIR